MVTAGDFRNGVTFEMDGAVWQIIEFQHVKPGKGAAFVRTKLRNVIQGSVVEKTFSPTDKFPTAYVERKEMEYSYNDGDLYYFMDPDTYELVPISKDELDDNFKFVKEQMVCRVLSYKGKVHCALRHYPGSIAFLPGHEEKPATLETGAEIKVPLFIDEGEMIQVDTRTGEYMSRA